jgi:hypothetical protein
MLYRTFLSWTFKKKLLLAFSSLFHWKEAAVQINVPPGPIRGGTPVQVKMDVTMKGSCLQTLFDVQMAIRTKTLTTRGLLTACSNLKVTSEGRTQGILRHYGWSWECRKRQIQLHKVYPVHVSSLGRYFWTPRSKWLSIIC